MRKQSVSINSLVILLSVTAVLIEMGLYYFIGNPVFAVLSAVIFPAVLTKFFIEASLSHETVFLQSAIMVLVSFVCMAVIFMIQPNTWISFRGELGLVVLLNWLVPVLICTFTAMFDKGPRIGGYQAFFYKASVLFLILYTVIMIDRLFVRPVMPPYKSMPFGAANFVAFMELGTRIEEVLRGGESLFPIFKYIIQILCFGIPFGFFGRLFMRRILVFPRNIILFAVPLLIEFLQDCIGIGRGSIDEYFLAAAGVVLGIGVYHLADQAFCSAAHHSFLQESSRRSGY